MAIKIEDYLPQQLRVVPRAVINIDEADNLRRDVELHFARKLISNQKIQFRLAIKLVTLIFIDYQLWTG